LAIHDQQLTVCGQKLSVAIEMDQGVAALLFLILKSSLQSGPTPERAPSTLATAAAPGYL
jgi:hypothetical protein